VRAAEWMMKPSRANWRPWSLPHLEVPTGSFKDDYVGVPMQYDREGKVARYLVPTAGVYQLGDTAYGLQRVAAALGDAELDRLARGQVQWAIGHNPFNVSYICRFGTDSLDQFYSFSQGRMPGCVGGFGIGNSGVPGARRPYSGEPVTNAGMRLLRAMITAAQPGRLELTVLRAGKPGPQDVVIRWPVSGEVVFRGRTDGNGKLPGIALDGGQSYELTCGPVKIPLSIVSGTSIKRTVRLDKIIALAADAPRVRAGEPFTVRLTVSNLGTSAAPVKLTVHAEDATTATPERTIAPLEPGTSRTIDWPFVAGEPGRAYVLCFEPDGDRGAILDFTGPIPFQ